MTVYRRFFDTVLVHSDAETAHRAAFAVIRAATPVTRRILSAKSHRRGASCPPPVRAMGLEFPGILGLAAGFDKDAVGIDALAALGFGFVEVGTVTAEPQPGNERPRLFRLPLDRAVVNRMGFNNDGAAVVAERLARRSAERARRSGDAPEPVVGVNIGKTKVVPDDDQDAVVADYRKSTRLLAPYADYLVVNVSSPNTPGLRALQSVDRLEPLLLAVREEADAASASRVPLLVKIAPDLTDDDVLAVADLATGIGLDGIIATNTTILRDGLRSPTRDIARVGAGGISGAPVRDRALAVLRLLRDRVGADLTLIGVGGISTPEDAVARLEAGADLLQGYTAFAYEGPLWPSRMNQALQRVSEGTA